MAPCLASHLEIVGFVLRFGGFQRVHIHIIELNSGTFEFAISENEFPVVINIVTNTNFILDVLTELDNERAEKQGLRDMGGEMR